MTPTEAGWYWWRLADLDRDGGDSPPWVLPWDAWQAVWFDGQFAWGPCWCDCDEASRMGGEWGPRIPEPRGAP